MLEKNSEIEFLHCLSLFQPPFPFSPFKVLSSSLEKSDRNGRVTH